MRLKLLYFAPHQLWPVVTGARLRDYHLARELAARGARVTFVELLHPGDDRNAAPPADAGLERTIGFEKGRSYTLGKVLRGMLGPVPVTVLNLHTREAEDALTRLLRNERFDSIQLEGPPLAAYARALRAASPGTPVLLDWHNIESELMRRYAESAPGFAKKLVAWRTAGLLEAAENRLLAECEAHAVASERERQALLARAPGAAIHVIPNGVDTSWFVPSPEPPAAADILFVGSMDYHANIDGALWFAREVWPAIEAARPDVRFLVVGRNPAPAVRALASARIEVTGTVEDLRPYYARAAVVVAPLLVGSGTRLKILEAMAAGVPVVSTPLGAEGIDAEDGRHLLLAASAPAMAEAVLRLAGSPESRGRLAAAARAFVEERYAWPAIGAELWRIHCRLAGFAEPGMSNSVGQNPTNSNIP